MAHKLRLPHHVDRTGRASASPGLRVAMEPARTCGDAKT
jgi:hypothetical protein